jgi:hypothetical protein
MKTKNDYLKEDINYLLDNLSPVKSSIDNSPTFKLDNKIIFDVNELVQESHINMEYVGETIETKARELLAVYRFDLQTRNFYAYLMREIIRNVVEHSEATKFIVMLYSNNQREIAFKVIDNGIGIKKSINTNPSYEVLDDLTALAFCVRPGITRSYKRDPYRDDVWQNSGFGLFMVSSIVEDIGSFEITSGNSKLIFKNGFREFKKGKIKGTEVTVILNTSIKVNVPEVIKRTSKEGSNIAKNSVNYAEFATLKTASKASILLK